MTRQEKIWSEWLSFKEEKKRMAETCECGHCNYPDHFVGREVNEIELPPLGTCIDITAECGRPGRYESTVKAWIGATFSQEGRSMIHVDTFEVHDEDGSFMKKLEWRAAFSEAKEESSRRFNA